MAEKIGVYIDESSVAPLLSAEELVAFVKEKCGGACPIVKSHKRLSSEAGVAMIKADVDSGEIDAVLICGTSPRVDWDVFNFGDKVLTDRVNLREFVVLSYKNPDGSPVAPGAATPRELTAMVRDYLRMGVVKLQKMNRPNPEMLETVKTILVLGGGFTGLNAALSAAGAGSEVILVEKEGVLGGKAAGLYKTFPMSYPYLEATDTGIDTLIAKVAGNSRIKVRLNTTLKLLAGAPGQYEATLASGGSEEKLPIGAVVLAAGWTPMDTEVLAPFGYGTLKNVVTSAEFEAMAKAGDIKRPSDGRAPATVAFLVDVTKLMEPKAAPAVEDAAAAEAKPAEKKDGEAEEPVVTFNPIKTPKHLAYASELTSLVALKQANYVREKLGDAVAMIIYDNMMVPGINERYYKAAQDNPGIMLTKGTVTGVTEEGASLVIAAKDTLLGGEITLAADLVVLPTGMVPATALDPVVNLLYRQGPAFPDLGLFDGFADSNYICFPYETRRTGVYAAGCVRQPMTMAQAKDDAAGAALKAIQCVESASRGVAVHPRSGDLSYPVFNFVRCTQCKRCTEECPFGALDDDEKGTPKPNPTRCRRCGTCMGACPERVISFDNYNVDMIGSMIRECEIPPKIEDGGPRVLILACENDAYPALDMAALRGQKWSPYVRIIPVRCLGSVNAIWVADAMSKGVDGVMLLGCKYGDDYQCHFVKGSEICNRRKENIAESLKRLGVEPERVEQYQVAIDEYDQVPGMIDQFMDMVLKIGPNPFKGY
ncbi:methyl-viologen-reducing hydrogenase delta subunit [Solidesulfovibrio carbinoliphilus subsp. oakridgensis]|uniref:Methyl-viologen-reducing hydrogenase delta subunit n=1 Tax=Solidesulfovibrio carbinoliphilus subsp. oakridgensis TaxID=694327 RepID=G7QA49_9BACT|nr:hydrogenase iron-sulfur subunit [Solidesulfovibrio carbinoliphilus]EHJ47879.1 methyl-viologen-reducing hydrogenase delta subunit [Solidesulfovibrio carbinoliphilus subsp. oakridgensis]